MEPITSYLVTLPRSGTFLVDRIMSRVAKTLNIPYAETFAKEFPCLTGNRLVKSHDTDGRVCRDKAPHGTQFVVLYRDNTLEQADAMMRYFHENTTNASGAYLASYATHLSTYFDTFTKKWCNEAIPDVHVFRYNEDILQNPETTLSKIARIVFREFDIHVVDNAVVLAVQAEEGGISRRNALDPSLFVAAKNFMDMETVCEEYRILARMRDEIAALVPPLDNVTDNIVSHGIWRRYPYMMRMFAAHAKAETRTIPLWTPLLSFEKDKDITTLFGVVWNAFQDASCASVWLIDAGASVEPHVDCRKCMADKQIKAIVPLSGQGKVIVGTHSMDIDSAGLKILTNHLPIGVLCTSTIPLVLLVLEYSSVIATQTRTPVRNQFDELYEQNMHEWGIRW